MAYNHLKDKVKAFLQPFAESGQAVGAEDIKTYFEKLRGDEQGTEAATLEAGTEDRTDNRKEQDGMSTIPILHFSSRPSLQCEGF